MENKYVGKLSDQLFKHVCFVHWVEKCIFSIWLAFLFSFGDKKDNPAVQEYAIPRWSAGQLSFWNMVLVMVMELVPVYLCTCVPCCIILSVQVH